MEKFYIATAIAYVNAPPHIGHALEFLQADALKRFYKLRGVDAFYLTGTDEHGTKIYETAQKAGKETQEFVDENAAIFESLKEILDLDNDDFIRTTQQRHKDGVQQLWKIWEENGDIYKGSYKGNYCVGCESYIPDKDLDENGNCPIHKKPPKVLEEENYFFRLSKYSDRIKAAIESGEVKIIPESRKNEMLNIIGEEGLRDVSFSRPKNVLPWGVPVPGDDDQVMYVWADALSNYITGIGYAEDAPEFKKYWPCDAQIIGKDILRFHAGIWIGMMMSAGIPHSRAVYVHGFITSEGQKMSKSLGNVVDPLEYVEKYDLEPVRYYLLREIPTTDDGDFSHERFVALNNSELANGLGNLVNRVTMMVEKYCDGKVPPKTEVETVKVAIEKAFARYVELFEAYDIKGACETLMEVVNIGNKYIDDEKPWAKVKEGESVDGVMYVLLEVLKLAAAMLGPILPKVSDEVTSRIGAKDVDLNYVWGQLEAGAKVASGAPLFPRIEED